MIRNLRNLVAIRFKEFFREPEIIFWAMIFPILLSWLLGVAIGSDSRQVRSVAVTGTRWHTADSAAIWIETAAGGAARVLSPEKVNEGEDGPAIMLLPMTDDDAVLALKKGKVSLTVERSEKGTLIYRFDPKNTDAERTWLVLERAVAGLDSGKETSVRELEMPGTRYIDYLLPGLLAMNLMNSAMWGVGWSLIETRMKKFLRRMAATPMSRQLFLGSYYVTRLIINGLQFAALYLFVFFYFGVKIQGSIPALIVVFLSGNLAFTGIAILISSRTANSRVGNGMINAITLPMMLLSGIFFSYNNFPEWSIPLVRLLPLTVIADSLRSIFNEGAGFSQVGLPSIMLALAGAVMFYAGSRIFKWY